jgi:FxsC-like protein
MGEVRRREAGGLGLYFFLSYAHNNSNGRGNNAESDTWVAKFFRDLCDRIRAIEDLPMEAQVGFMDRELGLDHHWPVELSRALATCRVFMPLYSRRYFESEHCGKEWYAFRKRALSQLPNGPAKVEEIVPALWVPIDTDLIPAARETDFDHSAFGEFYAQQGIYRIIKLSRYADAYLQAVDLLARRVIEVAERSPVRPDRRMDYDALPSAFGTAIPPMPGDCPLRITIAAPHRGRMPKGRSHDCYGATARDWNPYRSESAYALADYIANLARSLGYRPYVSGLCERQGELLNGDVAAGPGLLLVDPWAAVQPDLVPVLRQFDATDQPWVQVAVAWSGDDKESAEAEGMLRAALDSVLPRKLAQGRVISSIAANGVPSLGELVQVLPTVIKTADDHYLKHARVMVPQGQVRERARLALLTAESAGTER